MRFEVIHLGTEVHHGHLYNLSTIMAQGQGGQHIMAIAAQLMDYEENRRIVQVLYNLLCYHVVFGDGLH